ncbi:MAG TPA: carbohydrate-binding protein [Candidatus Binatia bacterium]|nr:carbohydrate-binding protein [Candidatus Binatia bacterium]
MNARISVAMWRISILPSGRSADIRRLLTAALLLFSYPSTIHAGIGATTPFISYEAESGFLGGGATVVSVTAAPTNQFSSPEMEASGHAYVQLTATGQYVQWTNNTGQSLTAINLRSCIPDAPAGGGITSTLDLYVNGVFRQAFAVNSQQNYCYEGTNYNGQTDKTPTDGNPRGFWNDTRAFVTGAPIAPGDALRFQMDAANTAAFYDIDVVDLETPPPPLGQPANSLSILSYGAVSNNIGADNTTAINNCFSAARAQGRLAWIPAGTYYFSAIHGGLNAAGITILGAGPWYSTLYRVTPVNNSQGVANIITTISCTLSNVSLDCNGSSRAGNNNNGAVNFYGTNWVVDNVWIQHVTSAFWCAGVGGTARNCRVLSVWSDGGNFNNVQSDNGLGMNLTYSNNFVRGTGDDAMAINSVNYNTYGSTTYYYTMMSNITYINNTAVAPWGGKCIGIYGGINDLVTNNLLCDTARYTGLGVMKFGVNGSDLLSATVTGNTVLRCGGNGYNQQQQALMIGNGGDGQGVGTVANAYCAYNTIIDALYDAVGFSTSTNIVLQRNTIINPGLDAIAIGPPDLGSGVMGSALIYSNSVSSLKAGHVVFTNSSVAYAGIIPSAATGYNNRSGVVPETCSEGGQDLGNITAGDWVAYNNVNLNGINTFVARVASTNSGSSVQIHLDSISGTLIGTCSIPVTGGSQAYANAYCGISGASGTHTVYLVFSGGSGDLCHVEYFAFYYAPPAPSHQLVTGDVYSLSALGNGKYVTEDSSHTNLLFAEGVAISAPQQFQIVAAGGGNIALLSLANSNYVSAENNGNSPLVANRTGVGLWETFTEVDAGNGNIGLRAMNNGKYVTVDSLNGNVLIAKSTTVGTQESFTVGFVTGVAPPPPGGVTASPGNSQVILSWAASAGATAYNVKRSTINGGPYGFVATNTTGLSYTNLNLTNGTTYYYVVTALNPAGESTNSAQVSAIPGALNRAGWVASASSTESGGSPAYAIDGNISTRWSTGAPQMNGQWFQVDMNGTNICYELSLDAGSSSSDYPRGYQVNVSKDGSNWGTPVATGAGTSALTLITFPPQTARYIRVTQTGSVSGLWWSIHEFNVVGQPVSLSPPQLVFVAGAGQVQLAWPNDHLGWALQVQTNPPSAGLGTNWVTQPSSAATNQVTIPIDSTSGSVFFRLVFP